MIMAMSLAAPFMLRAEKDEGRDTIEDYLRALDSNPNDKNLLKAVAYHYMNVSDYNNIRKYAQRLLALGKATGDRDFCELYGKIAMSASFREKDNEQCFKYLEDARAIAESTQNHDALLSINNGLGMYYMFTHNDLYTASSYYYKALEEAKALNDERRYGIILSNLAGAYLIMGDVSGRRLAEQSHEIAVKRGEPIPLYYAKYTLAEFYLLSDSIGSIDRVEALADEIEQLHREGGFGGKPDLYLVRAQIAEKRGNIPEAYRYYGLAMENFKYADMSAITATYLAYASMLRRNNRANTAIKVLEYGLDTSTSSDVKIHSPEIIKELIYSYRDAGNYRKALDYSLDYLAYQDSVFNISRERALQENRIRHEVYTNELLIDEQKMQLMSSRHRIILLVVCVAAVLLLLGLTYFNYRKKDRLYRAIVSQNKEYLLREQMMLEQIEKSKGEQQPAADHPKTTTLAEEKADDLMSRFTVLMSERKLFKDPSLTVCSVAELLDSNRTYVSRAINDQTGKTFTQIVNEYRIREAISLISDLESNLPLKQICSDVGFNSISTFYTTFQAVTGMTPARYRSHLKEI